MKDLYPDHYRYFLNLQGRSDKVGTDFSNDASGYLEFVEEIGPFPLVMVKPTVGRKNHNLGYVTGNIFWQPFSENAREVRLRVPVLDQTRERMSESHQGKSHFISEETKKKISDIRSKQEEFKRAQGEINARDTAA